ncbi:sigma-70 family RNA polymerase sigma factor [Pleomorphomonas sp. NRK KF1]|uniref:sigma-70 family RNA polymerase sigma factor n=1 Tax=Pleomorphomonas sp. NRK KF1 TaxID=2943000 RepID=UPI00204446D7|nr:sigma-70 family RNA polymerase sigma factor [Pleomorphomonas sp. NRK KF1]MCM5552031.1 sigma-70 family RNA polymerase sigma factor [Pleomorphomonas sp. NRK KF1]
MSEESPERILSNLRPGLIRIAYRMLGSVAEAEDIVQETAVRWLAVDHQAVREPAAFLRRIVTRLCLNELQSARRRREAYVGPWLPEPYFDPEDHDQADDITLPLMIALERLSPLERAAFLLHDIFGMPFDQVADIVGREAPACRKLASRARAHIQEARPRFAVDKDRGLELARAFFTASRSGDMTALRALLAEDVVAIADGGGRIVASLAPLVGLEAVLARHAEMARSFAIQPSQIIRYATIDGLPGFVTIEAGGTLQTTALDVIEGRITAIYVTRNPDKLRHVSEIGVQ